MFGGRRSHTKNVCKVESHIYIYKKCLHVQIFQPFPPTPSPIKKKKKLKRGPCQRQYLPFMGAGIAYFLGKIQMTLFQIGFYVNRFLSRKIKAHKMARNRPVDNTGET